MRIKHIKTFKKKIVHIDNPSPHQISYNYLNSYLVFDMELKGIHKCMSILYDVCLVLESNIRGYLAARYLKSHPTSRSTIINTCRTVQCIVLNFLPLQILRQPYLITYAMALRTSDILGLLNYGCLFFPTNCRLSPSLKLHPP